MANKIVQLHDEQNNNIYPITVLDSIHGIDSLYSDFVLKAGDTVTGPLTATKFIGPVEGNADTATKLKTIQTIDGINFNGESSIVHYGVCETAASTAAKTVSINGFNLIVGAAIDVKFKNTNSASSPTLNVNSLGAKPIVRYGTTSVGTSSTTNGGWPAGAVLHLIYDGTSWVQTHWNNTTYTTATTSSSGLMSASDKTKLNNIANYANCVSFTKSLTAGTLIGTLTIDDSSISLYAPTNTDTHYQTKLIVSDYASGNTNKEASNGSVYLNLFDNSYTRESHLIAGTGGTTVTSESDGSIWIDSIAYSGQKGISISGGLIGHSNEITEGTIEFGQELAFGETFTIPKFTYDAYGHIKETSSSNITLPAYDAEKGIILTDGKFGHSNEISEGSVGSEQQLAFGDTFTIPKITYDAHGHITEATTVNITLPENDTDIFLPLTAGEDKKLTGPLGFTIESGMYGTELPNDGFDGQLFFLEDTGASLPTGGSAGQALVKNSIDEGDASWKSSQISWVTGTSAGPKPKIFGVEGSVIPTASTTSSGIVTTDAQTFSGSKTFTSDVISTGLVKAQFIAKSDDYGFMIRNDNDSTWFLLTNSGDRDGDWNDLRPLRIQNSTGIVTCGTQLYGAVWNDYAEFRTQKEIIEPGYCVASTNNGQVYKTTEKFQACDGIVSDTFGFAIGETDECKTPLAVAGRVLVYFHGNREDYQSGDTVCAGPEGKIIKMTREEIKEYPDRIIGIVSEIPEYETWGSGNVAVNNRIWIKVK